MRVLSLFDGMSCGQIAINKLGIKDYTYYASEIDKYAISITQKNFPNTIQVGDITKLNGNEFSNIDLMLAGSPCQGFSFAGNQLAFDDPRSKLFFEFVRLLEKIKPKYFLLENVRMKKEYLNIITQHLGVEPILINSSLLSAQSRQRYYWTNIPNVSQPKDKGIVLKDILETNTDSKYNLSEEKKDRVLNAKRGKGYFYNRDSKKIGTVMALYHKDPTDGSYIEDHKPVKQTERNRRHLRRDDQKSLCMTATMYKGAGNNGMTLVPHKYKTNNNITNFKINNKTVEKYVPNVDGEFCDPYNKKMVSGNKSTALRTNSSNGNLWVNQKPKQVGVATDINGHDILKRIYSPEGKSPTINTMNGGNREPKVSIDNIYWRKLTPLECERLQTVPDNYTEGVSNTQRYKMLGNGWTCDVISHLLKNI